jgi:hypothetical protein
MITRSFDECFVSDGNNLANKLYLVVIILLEADSLISLPTV